MGVLQKVIGAFSGKRGSALARYRAGMALAKDGNFGRAIEEYTIAIDSPHVPSDVQAMAMYNRSLAYSSQGSDAQAAEDLERLLDMHGVPERIRTQAIQRQHRIAKRETRRAQPEH